MFGLEKKSLAPDLQDRGWLEGCGNDKKSQLRVGQGPIFSQLVLPMDIFQPPLEVQSLGVVGKGKDNKVILAHEGPTLSVNNSQQIYLYNCCCNCIIVCTENQTLLSLV